MKITRLLILLFSIGVGLTACSSFSPTSWKSGTETVEGPDEPSPLDSIISPYREKVEEEMTNSIGRTPERLEKDRPCSALNNWAADAVMTNQISALGPDRNFMVLLNVGGLRSALNEGEITVGDIYQLMPFDNEVVFVKMPMSALEEIANYIKASGGEPIANARLKNGKLDLNILYPNQDDFWIMTSDYLMNGGDRMDFFSKKVEVIYTKKLLRDVFIEEVMRERTLVLDKTCRVNVE